MQIVAHNLASMFTDRQLKINTNQKTKSTGKLSSGYRINRSADDAAGLAISEKMRYMIRGLDQGLENTMDGISFVQIADGAMAEAQDMVNRMNELAVQAANGTNSESDRKAIDDEIQQLKTEIDRIAYTTKFNEEYIFDKDSREGIDFPTFSVTARYFSMTDIEVFNSSYDAASGKAEFGGIILNDERITWDAIDSDMAYFDDNGTQRFRGGTYSLVQNGVNYEFDCADGAEVPRISRNLPVTQGIGDEIYIGGELYHMSDFTDEDGKKMSLVNMHGGTWTNEDKDKTIELDFHYLNNVSGWDDPQAAAVYAISHKFQKVHIVESSDPDNAVKETAIVSNISDAGDASVLSKSNITSETVMKNILDNEYYQSTGNVVYRVRAAKEEAGDPDSEDYTFNGVWLERPSFAEDESGNSIIDISSCEWEYVTGSLKTWSEVGLADDGQGLWSQGTDMTAGVYANVHYDYYDSNTMGKISFEIESTVTSLDSVIDGIDQSTIYGSDVANRYGASGAASSEYVSSFRVSLNGAKNYISPQEEYDIGRNYETKAYKGVATGTLSVDNDVKTVTVTMSNPSDARTAGTSIEYAEDISAYREDVADDVARYLAYVNNDKLYKLAGVSSDSPIPGRSLAEVVHAEKKKIWGDGENTTLSDSFTPDSTMNITKGYSITKERMVNNGKELACAWIDFSEVTNLARLAGTGFDSTCSTCNDHYSTLFTKNADTSGYKSHELSDGSILRYKLLAYDSQGKDVSDYENALGIGQDFILEIDLNSLIEAGFTGKNDDESKNLAYGLVEIYDAANFDGHYTQYASEGSKLYVFEERVQDKDTASKKATFKPSVYVPNGVDVKPVTNENYTFTLYDTQNQDRTISLNYTYELAEKLSDYADDVTIEMQNDDDRNTYYTRTVGDYGAVEYESEEAESETTYVERELQATDISDENEEEDNTATPKTKTKTWTETETYVRTETAVTDLGIRYVKSGTDADGNPTYTEVPAKTTTVTKITTVDTYTCSRTDTWNEETQEWEEGTNVTRTKVSEEIEPEGTRDTSVTDKPANIEWYMPNITLKDRSDGTTGTFEEKVNSAKYEPADGILENMLQGTAVSFDAKDYTSISWDWEENENEAVDVPFMTSIWTENIVNKKFLKIYHSSNTNDYTVIPQFSLDTNALGLLDANCRTEEGALDTINKAGWAQRGISKRRSMYGAIQNRLEHTYNNRYNTMENTIAAESRIRDTDVAKEMVAYAGRSIIEQAGQSMLTQANQSTQGILALLQG